MTIYSGWRSARSRARTETNLEAWQDRSCAAVDCVRRVLLRPPILTSAERDFDPLTAALAVPELSQNRALTISVARSSCLEHDDTYRASCNSTVGQTREQARHANRRSRDAHTTALCCSDASSRSEQGERLRGRAGLKYGLTCPRPTGK